MVGGFANSDMFFEDIRSFMNRKPKGPKPVVLRPPEPHKAGMHYLRPD